MVSVSLHVDVKGAIISQIHGVRDTAVGCEFVLFVGKGSFAA
jgi:hypothetical protein